MQPDLPTGLRWYPDNRPGITRRKAGRGWSYRAPDGTTIDNRQERARINALAVPPAYENVWISPLVNGHLQATGRDAAARKQYRYHEKLADFRARTKFDRLAEFGAALPRIRRHIHDSLQGEPDSPDFAIAAVLRLIDRASLRVGTPEYAEDRKTYGATTLRSRHVDLGDDGIRLHYRGKGGQMVKKTVRDQTLQRALQRLDDLPGGSVIQWQDEAGETRTVGPEQINGWLRDRIDGATAKTFRTWNGSVAALETVLGNPDPVTIKTMCEAAADRLHNTPAIARKSYIHPDVIALAGTGTAVRVPDAPTGLRQPERALLGLLGA